MKALKKIGWMGVWLIGCQDYRVREGDPPPPAEPPGLDDEAGQGDPPDWANCSAGWLGQYFNFPVDHPDTALELQEEEDTELGVTPAPEDPLGLDWWDQDTLAFQDYDASLDIGVGWWPVDQGLTDDPANYAVRWTAWIRVQDSGTLPLVVGASTDLWVLIDGEVVIALPGPHPFETLSLNLDLRSGQYPIEVRYAHRGTPFDSGVRFRLTDDSVTLCYPEFE